MVISSCPCRLRARISNGTSTNTGRCAGQSLPQAGRLLHGNLLIRERQSCPTSPNGRLGSRFQLVVSLTPSESLPDLIARCVHTGRQYYHGPFPQQSYLRFIRLFKPAIIGYPQPRPQFLRYLDTDHQVCVKGLIVRVRSTGNCPRTWPSSS